MNEIVKLLKNHRSIRRFKDDPVTGEQLQAMLDAAQMASTSSNMQAYSVIGVTDPGKKRALALLAGNQQYVEQCPLFLVWCADLYRIDAACKREGGISVTGTTENFIVGTVDTALAAQNAAIAAESAGLGIIYIGGIRNEPQAVSDLLGLPRLVYPLFGMCVGTPAHEPTPRPRLPREAIYHPDGHYSADNMEAAIGRYDETLRSYMLTRSGGTRDTTWSREMTAKMVKPVRLHMRDFLRGRSFEML